MKKGNKKRRSKSSRATFEQRFQPASSPVTDADDHPLMHEEERGLKYLFREPVLPDVALIHGRALVAAWEQDLESAEDEAVELLTRGVEDILRRLVTALVMARKGFAVRDGHLPCAVGRPRPNPWRGTCQ